MYDKTCWHNSSPAFPIILKSISKMAKEKKTDSIWAKSNIDSCLHITAGVKKKLAIQQ